MQDRLKFRVWEKDQKIMKECTQITLDKDQTGSMCDVKGKVTAHLIYQPHYIIMQCTGLRDKNGKLIYEGDIVKYAEYDWSDIAFKDWEQEIGKVVWGGNHSYPAFDLEKHNFECNSFAHIFNDGWTIEVIGNIYENEDLLNAT